MKTEDNRTKHITHSWSSGARLLLHCVVSMSFVCGILGSVLPLHADSPWDQVDEIKPADGNDQSYFGETISTDGEWAIIGAWGDDEKGLDAGAAYIYHFESLVGWVEVEKIFGFDTSAQDRFGAAVAIDYPWALVGAPLEDALAEDAGAVHIWHADGMNWNYTGMLLEDGGVTNNEFGRSVAIHDDHLIVGAPLSPWTQNGRGSVYIYKNNDSIWEEVFSQQFIGGLTAGVGFSVDINTHTALVGAPYDNAIGFNDGAVWVITFDGSSWELTDKLHHWAPEEDDEFGISVSLDEDMAIIGAWHVDDVDTNAGAAYIFYRSWSNYHQEFRWEQIAELLPFDGHFNDLFGRNVAIDNGTALVGATGDDDLGHMSGSAYFYKLEGTQWNFLQKVNASDGDTGDYFGSAVALTDAADALIGASADEDNGIASGTVYEFLSSDKLLGISPQPILPGETVLVEVVNMSPNTMTYLADSITGRGNVFIPPLNVTVYLDLPQQVGPGMMTDESGYAAWEFDVPPNIPPFYVWVQAVQQGNTSNVVPTYIE